MDIFDSTVATISYFEDSKLIRTTWKHCEQAEQFMPILLEVRDFYEQLRPRKTLWDQRDFNFSIPPALQLWTDQNMNIPTQQLGILEKISFIVSKDVMAHMSVMQIFDETESDFRPKYFIEEAESLAWLVESPRGAVREQSVDQQPLLMIDSTGDRLRLTIEVDSEEFSEYLYLFNKLWRKRMLSVELAQRYLSLTHREKAIIKWLIKGKSNAYIADALCIAYYTVKTHRKNIYRKLGCNRIEDLMEYSFVL
mgnify:CR=1 FL=1